MNTPIYILDGEPRKIVEPEKPYENGHRCPSCEEYWIRYESALIKAHENGIGFEDEMDIRMLLPKEASYPFSDGQLIGRNLRDGLYHVDLPEHTEVRQKQERSLMNLQRATKFLSYDPSRSTH